MNGMKLKGDSKRKGFEPGLKSSAPQVYSRMVEMWRPERLQRRLGWAAHMPASLLQARPVPVQWRKLHQSPLPVQHQPGLPRRLGRGSSSLWSVLSSCYHFIFSISHLNFLSKCRNFLFCDTRPICLVSSVTPPSYTPVRSPPVAVRQ